MPPHLDAWAHRERVYPWSGAAHRHNHYIAYLRWYHSVTRAFLKPAVENPNIPIELRGDTDDEADDIIDDYDRLTQEGTQPERAPLQNYMVTCLIFVVIINPYSRCVLFELIIKLFVQAQQLSRLANEAGVAMAHTSRGHNAVGTLRAFAEVRTRWNFSFFDYIKYIGY